MRKELAEDYLDKLLNSVNDEKMKKEKFKETVKMLEDAVHFWEDERAALDFEEASYIQTPRKEEKRSEREDFLDALLSGAQNTEFGMNKKRPNQTPMYSRRVSKSEADFLKEFETELANDEDLSDLFGVFNESIEPEDRLEADDNYMKQQKADGFALGGVDLAALVDEAAGVMKSTPMTNVVSQEIPVKEPEADKVSMDPIPIDEYPMDDFLVNTFDDSFGEGAAPAADTLEQGSSGAVDLGNLGEADLMSLLAGADDLSDIGNMLSQNDVTEIPIESLDAFAAFAESEMSAQQVSAEPVEDDTNGSKKEKKGGFIGKLKSIISNLLKDDEDDEVVLKSATTPTVATLSGENADILAELEGLEDKSSKKKEKKKEKKNKPKKEKAPKKPKAPKTPKPKKEKKPKEVDNTPPLPKGPVVMIWLMVASLFALVLLGVNVIGYNSPIENAKILMNSGHYAEAFATLNGLTIKEKDLELYGQLAILSTADSELNAYEAFAANEMEDKAFDSLICAAGRCEINEDEADVYGCLGQLEILKKAVSNELEQKYNMTYDEAIEMYSIRDRDDYTIALYKKLSDLGIDWE